MKKIFIAQEVLDRLFSEDKADLEGDKLTIHSRQNQVYRLTPAYKFVRVVDDTPDKNNFVGKIFARTEMEKIEADIYMDSAIVREVAYHIEPGYIGLPDGEPPTGPADQEVSEKDENELLADYLLKIL